MKCEIKTTTLFILQNRIEDALVKPKGKVFISYSKLWLCTIRENDCFFPVVRNYTSSRVPIILL